MSVFLKNNRILVYIKNMSFEGEGGGADIFLLPRQGLNFFGSQRGVL